MLLKYVNSLNIVVETLLKDEKQSKHFGIDEKIQSDNTFGNSVQKSVPNENTKRKQEIEQQFNFLH